MPKYQVHTNVQFSRTYTVEAANEDAVYVLFADGKFPKHDDEQEVDEDIYDVEVDSDEEE